MPVSSRRPPIKPLLVGEQNPYGGDPHYALYPLPDGCSGHRLCHLILGMSTSAYLREFDRINLCAGQWSMREARKTANETYVPGRVKILLGKKVTEAHELTFIPFSVLEGCVILPHPSGLCRLWNAAGAFDRARQCVAKLVPHIAHEFGTGGEE